MHAVSFKVPSQRTRARLRAWQADGGDVEATLRSNRYNHLGLLKSLLYLSFNLPLAGNPRAAPSPSPAAASFSASRRHLRIAPSPSPSAAVSVSATAKSCHFRRFAQAPHRSDPRWRFSPVFPPFPVHPVARREEDKAKHPATAE
uniref:Uncharacterized protein n=1 Tax=Oryza punctata TaxID=4537 RepID=A0A0E0LKH1_ORYPU